ncbi:hypothetical protein XELAEV_18001685mg [Xenopus laevis]|uniref:Uncharacterized protein n=1 Tax=Xenopus laevis TaxID=8355 RepID=A0A974GYQ6_XENLA|nr:hypothetical protein XELAEV_18001685mg [Xenopus laevis]
MWNPRTTRKTNPTDPSTELRICCERCGCCCARRKTRARQRGKRSAAMGRGGIGESGSACWQPAWRS